MQTLKCGMIALCLCVLASLQLGRAQEVVLPASLRVTVEPAAQLAINHKVIAEGTFFQVELTPNRTALLRLSRPGYVTEYRTIFPASAERCHEEFKLKPVQTPVLFRCNVPAKVLCDGQELGATPFSYFFSEPKAYRIVFRAAGYEDHVVRLNLESAQPQVMDVTLSSDSATLNVTSVPSGATVLLNGVSRGVTPLTFERLKEGAHTVTLKMPSYYDYEQTVDLDAAEETTLNLRLRKLPSELTLESKPTGATIYINGLRHGQTPMTIKDLSEGTYAVRLECENHDTIIRSVLLKAGQKHSETYKLVRQQGEVVVQTQPATVEVLLNGKKVATTHPKEPNSFTSADETLRLPLGEHVLTFQADGYATETRKVMVKRSGNEPIRLRLTFEPNFEVQTPSSIYRGVLIRQEQNGAITLELRPGFFRTFAAQEIRAARFWKAKNAPANH